MDSISGSQLSVNHKSRPQTSRKVWTIQEEQELIAGLKELMTRGWKAENGFKTGYLVALEHHLRARFPDTDIRSDPHINSKIHVWKKQYGSLSSMLARSGFGWNDTANVIEVADDQIWNDYVKSDGNAKNMRHKQWPYYKDWSVIFGKDRATGETGNTLGEAVIRIIESEKQVPDNSTSSAFVPPMSQTPNGYDSDIHSACRGDSTNSPNKGKKKTKKRPRAASAALEGTMVEMMSEFFAKTDAKLDQLVQKVGFDECESLRDKVCEILDDMSDLSVEDKLTVSSAICDKKKDMELFCKRSSETRRVMVRMILDGRY